jgi:hypothetical protein
VPLRWIALIVFLSIGCGDDAPAIALEDLHAEQVRARCDYLVRCGLFASGDTCTTFFRVPDERELVAAVAAGKVRYDGASAQACQTALAALSCDQSSREARVVPACGRVFTGTIRDGAACGFDAECVSGRCDEPPCPMDTCCAGTCLPTEQRGAIGASCETDAGCAIDTYCGKDKLCHAFARIGEPCARDSECDYGLGCIGASELMDGTCRAMPLLGERCPYLRCAEAGAFCDAAKTCVPVGLPGTPCTSAAECSSYGSCDLQTGRCVDTPTLGMRCEGFCAGEAWCELASNTCVAPLENTAPCTSANQCASLFCNEGVAFDHCVDRPICL